MCPFDKNAKIYFNFRLRYWLINDAYTTYQNHRKSSSAKGVVNVTDYFNSRKPTKE